MATADTGYVTVEAIYSNRKTGEQAQLHSETQFLQVKVFHKDAHVAEAGLDIGATWNAGDFRSVRIDARARIPTYVEEMDAAYVFAQEKAVAALSRVHSMVNSGEIPLPGINAPRQPAPPPPPPKPQPERDPGDEYVSGLSYYEAADFWKGAR